MKNLRTTGWCLAIGLVLACSVGACNVGEIGSKSSAVDCLPSDPNALVFERAVCLCEDLDKVGSGLSTSGFSSYGRRTETERLAHVGINGQVNSVGSLKVDGTLDVAGSVETQASVMIKEDLFVGSDLSTLGHLSVDRDGYVGGDVSGRGQLEVAGALQVAGEVAMTGNLKCEDVAMGVPFEAHTPCPCNPEELIDVAAEVAAHRDAQPVELPSGQGHHALTLAEGDYYAAEGTFLRGNTRIKIEGAVRLFVEGDIELVGSGFIELTEGAELDLYLAGAIRKVGNLQVGYPKRPSASRAIRIYIGGSDTVELDLHGHTRLEGSIYAPTVDIKYHGNLTIEGALFARNVVGTGHLWVRYDAGIVGEGCDPEGDPEDECVPGDDTNPCDEDTSFDDEEDSGDEDGVDPDDGDVDGDGDGDGDGDSDDEDPSDGDSDGDSTGDGDGDAHDDDSGDSDGDDEDPADDECDPNDDTCRP